jgi:glycosyltransferase involved in cell wall biosynthesis
LNLNFTTPINQLGLGICGLNLLVELSKRIDVALFEIGPSTSPVEHEWAIKAGRRHADEFDEKAPSLLLWHPNRMFGHAGRGIRAGLTFFEVDPLPLVAIHHLNSLDVVLVPDAWAEGICRRSGVHKPIRLVPLGVDRAIFHDRVQCTRTDQETTVFFTVGKFEYRKGHDILIDAFHRAFSPSDPVRLIMACENPFLGEEGNGAWIRRAKTGRLSSKIDVIRRYGSQVDLARLIASCDVGVFPSRAEGWGLPLLESLSMGKPVITTDYAAHTAFCTQENARLIPIDNLENADDGVFFRGGGGRWAELGDAQLEVLIDHMRFFHNQKQQGMPMRNEHGVATATQLTWKRSADATLSAILPEMSLDDSRKL